MEQISYKFTAGSGLAGVELTKFADLKEKKGSQSVPITNVGYWQGRYVLTPLVLFKGGVPLPLGEAVVSVSRSKKVVKTPLVGLNGTIKECVGNEDFDLTIDLGIVSVDQKGNIDDSYPIAGVIALTNYLNAQETLVVESFFLNMMGITRIVIENYSLTQNTASNHQRVSIRACSDPDFNITSEEY